jgi:hypothetical protein
MVTLLEALFPGLARGGAQVTSPRDNDYNCIAWAAGDTTKWWWPGPNADEEYWPAGVPREVSLAAFQRAFASLGYTPCEGADLEAGFEKVALFANLQDRPTHAARQLPEGRWTSKLGKMEDIEHALFDLEGAIYGSVVLVMKRPRVPAETEQSPGKEAKELEPLP